MRLLESIQKQPIWMIVILALLSVILIGAIDYITGFELSFSVFYLIPIVLITWFVKKLRMSIIIALFAALVWLMVDRLSGQAYSSSLIPYWNAGVRLSFFLIVVFTLHSLQITQERREELQQFIIHDLRSPLSNTLAGLTLLPDISGETLDSHQQELVDISIASCNQMLTLVNSLLDLAKLESGHLQVEIESTSTKELFASATDQVSAMAIRKEVKIVSEIETNAVQMLVDRELMLRIIINIVTNALKYSPTGSNIYMRALSDKNEVAIQIQDEGPGIPKEWAEKVFSKFAQVDAQKSGAKIGSGIGLTFCRLAVEAQGGRIWITSDVGQGTTVILSIPKIR